MFSRMPASLLKLDVHPSLWGPPDNFGHLPVLDPRSCSPALSRSHLYGKNVSLGSFRTLGTALVMRPLKQWNQHHEVGIVRF